MATEKNIPEIRFKGFEGDWEENRLGSFSKFRRGSFPQPYGNSEWYDGEGAMPFVQVVDVTDKLTLVENTKQKISQLAQPKSVFVEKGKVVVTLQGSIGRVAILQYDAYLDRTLLIFESYEKETDSNFWAYTIQQKFEIEKKMAPGGTIKTITKEALSSFQILLPKLPEQTQIGTYFQNLDSLISLHQRKYDKLLTVKKAMLEKMFPKEGAYVPEIRFKGFDGKWVEKTLGFDIADIIGGGTPSTFEQAYWNGNIDWYSPTEIGDNVYANGSEKKITELGMRKCSARLLPAGKTILFTSRAGIGYMAILQRIGTTNQGFQSLVLKDNYNTYFIYSIGHLIKKYALKNASGSTFLEISGKVLGKMILLVPTFEEQTKIGTFFQNLDTLITQHQKELEKLKNLKKACLEKMFV